MAQEPTELNQVLLVTKNTPSSPSVSHVVLSGLTRVLYTCFIHIALHPHRTLLIPHPQFHGMPSTVPCGTVARNEGCGTIATERLLTGYEHANMFDIPEDYESVDAIFRDTKFTQLINYDSDGQYPDPTEVDDEHLRSECGSPLPAQERGARTDLTQTPHSDEESLLRSAELIAARTEKPSFMLKEQESSQRLED